MVSFNHSDFNLTKKTKHNLRDKLKILAEDLTHYAMQSCPNRDWDYYVTASNPLISQWAALYPIPVRNDKELLTYYPCIFQCATKW